MKRNTLEAMRALFRKRQTMFVISLVARFCLLLPIAVMALPSAVAPAQERHGALDWTRFELPANGVALRVPLGVFKPTPSQPSASGRLFVAADGEAQLLVGAFENDDGRSLAAHQKFVITSTYPTARIDYAPRRANWFVLSGTMDTRTFYQRVTFTCQGRLINSWAMIYPTRSKAFYDGLIEQMHKSFQAGRGPGGRCRMPTLSN